MLGVRFATVYVKQAWAARLFASHLLSHLIFLLDSWLDELRLGVVVMDDLSSAIRPSPLNGWSPGCFNVDASYSFMAYTAFCRLVANWQRSQSDGDRLWQCR